MNIESGGHTFTPEPKIEQAKSPVQKARNFIETLNTAIYQGKKIYQVGDGFKAMSRTEALVEWAKTGIKARGVSSQMMNQLKGVFKEAGLNVGLLSDRNIKLVASGDKLFSPSKSSREKFSRFVEMISKIVTQENVAEARAEKPSTDKRIQNPNDSRIIAFKNLIQREGASIGTLTKQAQALMRDASPKMKLLILQDLHEVIIANDKKVLHSVLNRTDRNAAVDLIKRELNAIASLKPDDYNKNEYLQLTEFHEYGVLMLNYGLKEDEVKQFLTTMVVLFTKPDYNASLRLNDNNYSHLLGKIEELATKLTELGKKELAAAFWELAPNRLGIEELACVDPDKNKRAVVQAASGMVDCNYNGTVGVDVCDMQFCFQDVGLAAVFDGLGHNNAQLVKSEHPIYEEFMKELHDMAQKHDYNHPDSDRIYQLKFTSIMVRYEKKLHDTILANAKVNADALKEFGELKGRLKNGEQLSPEEWSRFVELADWGKLTNMLNRAISEKEQDYVDFLEAVISKDQSKYHEALKKLEGVVNNAEAQLKKAQDELKAAKENLNNLTEVTTKDLPEGKKKVHHEKKEGVSQEEYSLAEEKVKKLEAEMSKASNRLRQLQNITHAIQGKESSTKTAGPAAVIIQILPTQNGQQKLFAAQYADCCYLVIPPKEDGSLDFDNAKWQSQKDNTDGFAGASHQIPKTELMDVAKGSLVVAFSDGYGEFTTKEEILGAIKEHHEEGAGAIGAALKNEIASHPITSDSDKEDTSRKQAVGSLAEGGKVRYCKKFDPTGSDRGAVDDLSLVLMRV